MYLSWACSAVGASGSLEAGIASNSAESSSSFSADSFQLLKALSHSGQSFITVGISGRFTKVGRESPRF